MFALNYISRHSAVFMILAYALGFAFPSAANAVLTQLPYVLFFLMFFTLLGISQPKLIGLLTQTVVWRYALVHSLGMTVLFVGMAYLLGLRGDLLLAIAATMATGSLFGTPAIVRSIGFSPLFAMGLMIAATLLMPLVLFANLYVFQTGAVHIDMLLYTKRLLIFIVGPMMISAIVHRFFSETQLHQVHQQLSKVTIILVMAFPFGLVGAYRQLFDQQASHALYLLLLGCVMCFGLFASMFVLYRGYSTEQRISAALASSGRNVLLTLTIAGPFLGTEFMALVGAIQLPTYALPLLAKTLLKRRYA